MILHRICAVSIAVHKVTLFAPACLLCHLEISLANDQNLSELMLVLSDLMHLVLALCSAYAYFHGFFPVLLPIGTGSD